MAMIFILPLRTVYSKAAGLHAFLPWYAIRMSNRREQRKQALFAMKPLIVLLGVFALCAVTMRLFFPVVEYRLSGRIALCAMLLFTATGHFAFTNGMVMMMPDAIPFKRALVYFTGLAEAAGGIGLLVPSLQRTAAVLLMVFFVLVLPVNVSAALKGIDYQKAATGGPGPGYLWFRAPLQILFIAWTWWAALR